MAKTKRQKIIIENILKVGDMSLEVATKAVRNFLAEDYQPIYTDNVLKEHIYDINGLLDEVYENTITTKPNAEVKKRLQEINKILANNDCAYLRIIYP